MTPPSPEDPRNPPPIALRAGAWDDAGRCRSIHEDREVRIQGAIPGERVAVQRTGRSRGASVDWARVVEVLEPSPGRRLAPCAIHDACGACGLQEADEETALTGRVESALPALPPPLAAALAPSTRWIRSEGFGYRHKAIILPDAENGLKLGGFARGTHDIVDLGGCAVLAPALRAAEEALREGLAPLFSRGFRATPPGSPVSSAPGLRAVLLRGNRGGEVLATMVATGNKATKQLRPLAARLVKGSSPIVGVYFQEHHGAGDAVVGTRRARLLAGARQLIETVGGADLTVTALGFFQVNPTVLDKLVQRILDGIGADVAHVTDLYCGGGAFGIPIAKRLGCSLHGVDTAEDAIKAATRDAAAAELDARFDAGTPSSVLKTVTTPAGRTVLILDPPRSGCRSEDLAAALDIDPDVVVQVSCSTRGLARDATALLESGRVPTELVPADMLPQTPHLEWLAIWQRSRTQP